MIEVSKAARVIVVQRQTVDWQNLTDDAFEQQAKVFCRLWSKPLDYVSRLRRLWDSTFALGYLETRALLKQHAHSQVMGVGNICFIPYKAYSNIPDSSLPYLFIDDDDWIAPDIASVFDKNQGIEFDALLGRSVTVGGPQQAYPVFVWGMNGRCMTNNYAISGVWLDHLQRLDEVAQHMKAEITLGEMPAGRVIQIDGVFSATNKSPCSSVSLDRGLDGEFTSLRLVGMVEQYLQKMTELTHDDMQAAPWVGPLVADMLALFAKVYASRFR